MRALKAGLIAGLIAPTGAFAFDERPATGFYFYRDTPSEVVVPRDRRNAYATDVVINGQRLRCVIDTGATVVTLGTLAAQLVGFDPSTFQFRGRANTANGVAAVESVVLDEVIMGPFVDRDIGAVVANNDNVGCLLGMNYIDRYAVRIELDKVVLSRR